ncbi:putative maltooligosyl trehalose synthase protein [Fulvimarina pelagi HTCC2506]|uniref:Putative maltooligosyl trehalose synthase protein n=2 Tax=Fulvimarina pelagi TaxID=217511 RepID=Q0FZG6_9HYPH|nr:malto-oligosyltrehalose synthase [Fulvimarina pelagi]EAU40312.1 putative maltooligosyl trehalose synthase protein [Fulvimarina pelagi HTCC2506]BAT31349.1 putative maltooligosyl trehalose synthase protein [Fulvimarina pelagi]
MTAPLVSTYRLQFREGTDFATARDLARYWKRLGISHLYASPIFAASQGSTHGYDVTDYNALEEDLGGIGGFTEMSNALSSADIGLILDFVPNHMGVSPHNHWWEDVLRWGEESRYAYTFDISWEAKRILVPVLGKPYGDALEAGDLTIVLDEATPAFRFDAAGYGLPIDPRTYGHVFGLLDHDERDRLVRRFSVSTPPEADELRERLSEHLQDESFRTALHAAISAINDDRQALHALHEAQAWRLAWWRTARERLTYRRFFEIADLIGVRQEMRRVFSESHQMIIRLARERRLDGVRIDHVDGLADPKTYLDDLNHAFRAVRRSPSIHVEKILTGEERLRSSWAIDGTTGYEFITALSDLYVDAKREEGMSEAYHTFIGRREDLRAMILAEKRSIFQRNLAGELTVLTGLALDVASRGLSTRDLGRDTLARSIVEVAAALPVYRTYGSVDGVPRRDVAIIDEAVDLAMTRREVEADEPIQFIGRLLKLDFEDGADVAGALNFTRRFQQTTGAVMAKAVEDTVFYRYNRLIALNEVGGEPDHYGADVDSFHEAMQVRIEDQPSGLLATTTHDTKRGEDARARIYTLSEAPGRWRALVSSFAAVMTGWRKDIEPGLFSPDPATEWGLYQALLGVLPTDFDPADKEQCEEIAERLTGFAEKAVREAKRYTSWTAPAEKYEKALRNFVEAMVDPQEELISEFWSSVQPFVAAGALNSLSQTAIKLTAPGVPDIYQGTEFYDFSLVDPDNRRPVDFDARIEALEAEADPAALLADWRSGRLKAKLTAAGLKMRQDASTLFTLGSYQPLVVEGPGAGWVVAFARVAENGEASITVAPRMTLTLLDGKLEPSVPAERWQGTSIVLPEALATRTFRDVMTEAEWTGSELRLADVLQTLPVAMLISA